MLGLVLVSALALSAINERDRLRELDEIAVTCLEPVGVPEGKTGCAVLALDKPVPITIDGTYRLTNGRDTPDE